MASNPRRCEWGAGIVQSIVSEGPGTGREIAARLGWNWHQTTVRCAEMFRNGYLRVVGWRRHYRRLARVYGMGKKVYVPQRRARAGQHMALNSIVANRVHYRGLAQWGKQEAA